MQGELNAEREHTQQMINKAVDRLDLRVDRLDHKLDRRFDVVEFRIGRVDERMDQLNEHLDDYARTTMQEYAKQDKRLARLERLKSA